MRAEPGETTRLKREAEELAVLAQVGWVITSSHRIDDVFPRFARAVERLIPWNVVTVSTVNVTGATSKTIYSIGEAVPADTNGSEIPVSGHLLLDVATSRRGMILDGLDRDAILTRYPGMAGIPGLGFDSWLCVPLIWRDECIAVLTLRARGAGVYSNRQLALAERVGMQIAGAVAHAQLLVEVRGQAHRSAVIAQIGRILASSLAMSDVLPAFAEHLGRLLTFDRLEITSIDPDKATVTRWSIGASEADDKLERLVEPLRGSLTELVLANRLSTSYRLDSHPSVLAVPLRVRNEIIGAMVLSSKSMDVYDQAAQSFAEQVADQISGTISNLRLHRRMEMHVAERELLADVARSAKPGIGFQELCERVCKRVASVIDFDRLVVTWADVDGDVVIVLYTSESAASDDGRRSRYPLQGSVAGEVARAGRGLMIDADSITEVSTRTSAHAAKLLKGFGSLIAVPIPLFYDHGASLQIYAKREHAYGNRELELAERIGEELGRSLSLVGARSLVPGAEERPPFTWAPLNARDLAWAWGDEKHDVPDESGGSNRIPLILIDRHPICRRGLEALFRNSAIQVEAVVANIPAAMDALRRYRPRVVLYEMHEGDSHDFSPLKISGHAGTTKILVIAENGGAEDVRDALITGASGFLLKSVSPVGLVNAVYRVAQGGTIIDPDLLSQFLELLNPGRFGLSKRDSHLWSQLDGRDHEILEKLVRGRSTKSIAAELSLSIGSVRNELTRIYRILGVSGRSGAISFALRSNSSGQ